MITNMKMLKTKENPTVCLSNKKQERGEDLFGFGGIMKDLNLPINKKDLKAIYNERCIT